MKKIIIIKIHKYSFLSRGLIGKVVDFTPDNGRICIPNYFAGTVFYNGMTNFTLGIQYIEVNITKTLKLI